MAEEPSVAGAPGSVAPESGWPPQAVPAPRELQRSFLLWIANMIATVAIGAASFLVTDTIPGVHFYSSTASGTERSSTGVGLVVFALLLVLIGYGLELLFAVKMRAGRTWARIVLTVIGVLGTLGNLLNLFTGSGFAIASSLVSLLLIPTAVVLMYRPAASAFIQARA